MSLTTDAMEREVAAIRAIRGRIDKNHKGLPTLRQTAEIDRHFARLMRLIAPRIRHFTRQYGLMDLPEDAEQACAIGVHRAVEMYDPDRARFTTLVNWQLRGELQSLRFRIRLDSRESARRVGARTVSIDTLLRPTDGDFAPDIEDEAALPKVDGATSARMAHEALEALLDAYGERLRQEARDRIARRRARDAQVKPGTIHPDELVDLESDLARERDIVSRYVFADSDKSRFDPRDDLTAEQQRQITRRVLRQLRAEVGASVQ